MGHVIAGNGRDDLPVTRLAANVARRASGGPLGELLPGVDHEVVLSTAQALLAEGVLIPAD